MNRLTKEKQVQVTAALVEGNSIRFGASCIPVVTACLADSRGVTFPTDPCGGCSLQTSRTVDGWKEAPEGLRLPIEAAQRFKT
jgi:hypothetical protein